MTEQSPSPTRVDRFFDKVKKLAERAKDLRTLFWTGVGILTFFGAGWLWYSPTTYGAILAFGKSLLSQQERSVAKTEPPPAQVKAPPSVATPTAAGSQCKRNLTSVVEDLDAHRERVSGKSWTYQQLFQDSLMGRSFCLVGKRSSSDTEKIGGYFFTGYWSWLQHKGELIDVYVLVRSREPPPEIIRPGENAQITGTLNDFSKTHSRRFDLEFTDATVSDRWAEALQETKAN